MMKFEIIDYFLRLDFQQHKITFQFIPVYKLYI